MLQTIFTSINGHVVPTYWYFNNMAPRGALGYIQFVDFLVGEKFLGAVSQVSQTRGPETNTWLKS